MRFAHRQNTNSIEHQAVSVVLLNLYCSLILIAAVCLQSTWLDTIGSPMPPSPPFTPSSSPKPPATCDAHTAPPLSSPPSLAAFSFSQFLNCHDGAEIGDTYSGNGPTRDSDVTATTRGNYNAEGSLSSLPLPTSVPILTFEDCMRFKLCLTCALCGRLLRHQPTAVETCGHCFCYDCINAAVEDGCVPLTQQWPWSRLTDEVSAAAARWSAAVAAAAVHKAGVQMKDSNKYTRSGATSSSAATTPQSLSGHEAEVVVTNVTPAPERPRLSPAVQNAEVFPSRSPRKQRKERHKCPLCLGPAFKWMLVSVPPIAELCTQLNAVYPALEKMLMHLTEGPAPATAAPRVASSPRTHYTEVEQKEVNSTPQSQRFISAELKFHLAAVAFTPSAAAQTARRDDERNSKSDEEDEDEEAVRRRRRTSGGPRKEVTFSDKVQASAKSFFQKAVERSSPALPPTDLYTISELVVGEHNEQRTEPEPSTTLSIVANASSSVVDGDPSNAFFLLGSNASSSSGTSPSLTSTTAATQHSIDLIPSPSISRIVPSTSAIVRDRTWGDAVAPNGGCNNAQTTSHSSQQQQHEHVNATPFHLAGTPEHSFSAYHKKEESKETPPRIARSLPDLTTVIAPVTATQALYVSGTPESIVDSIGGVPNFSNQRSAAVRGASSSNSQETIEMTLTRQTGCVLLDTASLPPQSISQLLVSLSKRDRSNPTSLPTRTSPLGFTFVSDGAKTTSMLSYSSVRTPSECCHTHLLNDFLSQREAERTPSGESGAATRPTTNAAVAVASVNPHDVWTLDAAQLRRHPRLQSCYVALRVGRITWCDEWHDCTLVPHTNGGQKPICVAGSFKSVTPYPRNDGNVSGRTVLTLSPAVCTAAVLGVPCIDIDWFFSTQKQLSWKSFAATIGNRQYSTTFENTFTKPLQRESLPRTPGLWIADTRNILLSNGFFRPLYPRRSKLTTESSSQGGLTAYYFFLMPDSAVAQLVDAFLQRWCSSRQGDRYRRTGKSSIVESPDNNEHENEPSSLEDNAQQAFTSRKRKRDDAALPKEAFGMSDGHPQRAWRRLLLVAGGAVVEISASLFTAMSTSALESEEVGEFYGSDVERVEDDDTVTLFLERHVSSQSADNWVHVDVDEGFFNLTPGATSHAESNETTASVEAALSAQHALFLLYSPVVAQEAYQRHMSAYQPTSSSDASKSSKPTAQPEERQLMLSLQRTLNRIAALIAYAICPVLPKAELKAAPPVTYQIRPASWLLTNVAEGRCSPCSCTRTVSHKARMTETAAGEVDTLESCAPSDTHGEQVSQRVPEQMSSEATQLTESSAAQTESLNAAPISSSSSALDASPSEASRNSPQRIGVYRGFLYFDTP